MPDLIETIEDGVATLTLNRPENLNALSDEIRLGLAGSVLAPRRRQRHRLHRIDRRRPRLLCRRRRQDHGRPDRQDLRGTRRRHSAIRPHTDADAYYAKADHRHDQRRRCRRRAEHGGRMRSACGRHDPPVSAPDFIKIGLSGDWGGTWTLTRLIGTAKARELFFTGDMIDAEEALRIGLINKLAEDADLLAATMALAHRIAAMPRVALGYTKKNLAAAETGDFATSLDLEAFNQARCSQMEDHREAVQAFKEKRKPVFVGR